MINESDNKLIQQESVVYKNGSYYYGNITPEEMEDDFIRRNSYVDVNAAGIATVQGRPEDVTE